MPEEALRPARSTGYFSELEIAQLPGSENLEVGQQVYLSNQYGQPFPVKVIAKRRRRLPLMRTMRWREKS